MPITSGIGTYSGLPSNIVEQIMDAEKLPINTLNEKKGKVENKLKLVNDLDSKLGAIKGKIGGLASARGFTDMKLTSGDESVLTGTVDPQTAVPGNWSLEVIDVAHKAAAMTNGFPDKDKTTVGVGYLKFKTPDGPKEVYISGGNSTLNGVADAINRSGVGMQASVVTDKKDPDNPYKLILSGKTVGGDNNIDYPTVYLLDGDMDLYFDEKREAKNGKIKIDGFEIDVPDNTLKDLIPGVVLDIKQSSPGKTINIDVKENREVVSGKVKDFVDSMNAVLGFIQGQNKLSKDTDTTQTLGGDSMLRSIENRLRQLIQEPVFGVGGNITMLNQIGITFNRAGTLEFDQKKFDGTLASNPQAVQQFLAGDGFATGFINKLKTTINTLTDNAFGPVANKRKGLQSEIDRADQRIESMTSHLEQKEKTIRRQFSNMEEKIGKIKGQGSMLAAKLGMGQQG